MDVHLSSKIRGIGAAEHIKWLVAEGKEIPDFLKPGFLLRKASKEDLEILQNLKSEDLMNDWPALLFPPGTNITRMH